MLPRDGQIDGQMDKVNSIYPTITITTTTHTTSLDGGKIRMAIFTLNLEYWFNLKKKVFWLSILFCGSANHLVNIGLGISLVPQKTGSVVNEV